MERRDEVEVLLAGLVVQENFSLEQILEEGNRDRRGIFFEGIWETAASSAVSALLASPSANRDIHSKASSSTVTRAPRPLVGSASALFISRTSSFSPIAGKMMTLSRDSSAPFSSNDGFPSWRPRGRCRRLPRTAGRHPAAPG